MLLRNQLWEPALLEQWVTVLRTLSMRPARMECSRPHPWYTLEYPISF